MKANYRRRALNKNFRYQGIYRDEKMRFKSLFEDWKKIRQSISEEYRDLISINEKAFIENSQLNVKLNCDGNIKTFRSS